MHFINGSYVEIENLKLRKPIRAVPHRSKEYDLVVAEWLVRYSIEIVHIRHIAWHSLGLVDVVKTIGLPIVFSFHDFYTVCPTVNLVDENYVYCTGQCTNTKGDCTPKLWPLRDFTTLSNTFTNSTVIKADNRNT